MKLKLNRSGADTSSAKGGGGAFPVGQPNQKKRGNGVKAHDKGGKKIQKRLHKPNQKHPASLLVGDLIGGQKKGPPVNGSSPRKRVEGAQYCGNQKF